MSKVFKVLTAVVFNFWFFYGLFLKRFDLFQRADTIMKWGIIIAVILYDIYVIAYLVERDEPEDIAPHDPNENKDYLDRF